MRRRYKLLAVLIGALVMLVVAAAIVAPMLVDSAEYRREVIALVKEHTGHDLHIDGKVRLHVLPRVKLTVTDVRLANPPGFGTADLARLPWLAVEPKLLALLAGRVEVRAIDLSGLNVHLQRDAEGRGNWESAPRAGNAGAAAPLAAIAIGAVNVRDASVRWHDPSGGRMISVPAINLQTGAVYIGDRIDDVRLQVTLPDGGGRIEVRGDAMLDGAGQRLVMPALTAEFHGLTVAEMRLDGTLRTRLTVDLQKQRLGLDSVRLSARAAGSADQRAALEITTALGIDLARQRLAPGTLSAKVPTFSYSGIDGELALKGVLSGDLEAGTYTLEHAQGSGILAGETMAGADIAFAMGGALNADLTRRKFSALGLEIAGSVDGDRGPFQLNTDLELSPRTRTLAMTDMQLSIRDWRIGGAMTLRSVAPPSGVQGVLDVRIQDQALAGSFSVTESEADGGGIDVRADLVADLDIADAGYRLRGRNAVMLRGNVSPGPADGAWRLADVNLGARLSDASFPGGELILRLQADMDVSVEDQTVSTDNLRLALDESRIAGSLKVHGFEKPAVRIDLQADRIDGDRYLPPGVAGASPATPIDASIKAIRALDFSGEVRVKTLLLKGVQLEDVRLTARGVAGDG